MNAVIEGGEKIKTSKGKLVGQYECKMKGCHKKTENYIRFADQITPICEEHKKVIEEWRRENKKTRQIREKLLDSEEKE